MSKLFSTDKIARMYAKYRPGYPTVVFSTILNYLQAGGGGRQLALDCGCGNGQATLELAKYFDKVIGFDVSEAQISQAPRNQAKVTFRVGQTEDMSYCKNSTVDLINVATALHYLNDADTFYKEAKRVLKPGGVLAAYAYSVPHPDVPGGTEIIKEFESCKLREYWDPSVRLLQNDYGDIILPFKDFTRVDDIVMTKQWTIEDLGNFLGSWTGYQAYIQKHPESEILEQIKHELRTRCDGRQTMAVNFRIFLLLGRN